MAISNAIGSERISKTVGYLLAAGNFQVNSPNLPQRIAIIGEANEADQATAPYTATKVISAKEAGEKFGYGSPIYNAVRILKPINSDGVGGIPIIVYAQPKAVGAVAKVITLTVTNNATANATHSAVVAGRESLDGFTYEYSVSEGDTPTQIAAKIADAINGVLGCPFIATVAAGVVTLTSKWAGLSSQDLTFSINTNSIETGVTYVTVETTPGSGTPSVVSSLALFQNEWNTIVLNTYSLSSTSVITELETFNGRPDSTAPTGRYRGIKMIPFIALTGSVDQENTALTDTKKNEVTLAVCPAPLSPGLPMEAAANMARLFARVSQDAPHLDVSGKFYPDMPGPSGNINMSDYDNRDAYVKLGNSTVDVIDGKYKVQDFVTTHHPTGEAIPQHRYCRNLMLDFNVTYSYKLEEEINVVDHAIANDNDDVNAEKVVKPKQWIGILNGLADSLAQRGLIADVAFFKESIVVGISSTNPDRFETAFSYKRTGFARVVPTTATAGFNYGSN